MAETGTISGTAPTPPRFGRPPLGLNPQETAWAKKFGHTRLVAGPSFRIYLDSKTRKLLVRGCDLRRRPKALPETAMLVGTYTENTKTADWLEHIRLMVAELERGL